MTCNIALTVCYLAVYRNHNQIQIMNEELFLTACQEGDIETVISLIDSVNIDFIDDDEGTFLMHASASGHLDIVDLLINKNPLNINNKSFGGHCALYYAVINNFNNVAKKLIENGADIEIKCDFGFTILMSACIDKNFNAVEISVNNGADLDAQDADGWTALMLSSSENYYDIVKYLTENGANVDLKNKYMETAYDLSVDENHVPVMYLLNKKIITEQNEFGDILIIKECRG